MTKIKLEFRKTPFQAKENKLFLAVDVNIRIPNAQENRELWRGICGQPVGNTEEEECMHTFKIK